MERRIKSTQVVDPMNIPMYVDIFQHIRGHNKHLTDEHLKTLSKRDLLNEVHPSYFYYFSRLLFPFKK